MLPDSIALPNGPVPVTWRRSARARRITLRIEPRGGGVIVTVPSRASAAAAKSVLLTHRDWVADRVSRLPGAVSLGEGARVPIHGKPHAIVHRPGLRRGVSIEGAELQVAGAPEFLARRVLDFLRAHARQTLGRLAHAKAASAGLCIRRVVVKDTSSRWGSCSAERALMFSWRLIMAPPEVQDYVVGHEVAHLRHMDHSPQFWALVAQLTPHRRFATAWLAAHGAGLMRVG